MSFGSFLWEIGDQIGRIPDNIVMGVQNALYTAEHPYSINRVGDACIAQPILSKPAHVKSPAELEKEKKESEAKKTEEYVYTPKNPRKSAKRYYGDQEPKVTKTQKSKSVNDPSVAKVDIKITSDDVYQKHKTEDGRRIVKSFVGYVMFRSRALDQSINQEAKRVMNGIGYMFGFKKLYPGEETVYDLRMYDPDYNYLGLYRPELGYNISISELYGWKNDADFSRAVEEKLAETEHPEDDPNIIDVEATVVEDTSAPDPKSVTDVLNDQDIIHPISFTKVGEEPEPVVVDNAQNVTSQVGFPDHVMEALETIFSDTDGSKRFYFIDGQGHLCISISNAMVRSPFVYMIDDGMIMGLDMISVLGNTYTNGYKDTLFVPIMCKDILARMFKNPMYSLTPDDKQRVLQYYFRNIEIYKFVDMSGTGFLKKLTADQFLKLGKKLTFIINIMRTKSDPGTELPRLRFKENSFESVERFTLVSDSRVKSPLISSGETSYMILDGLAFIVRGDNVTMRLNGTEDNFPIIRYGDL